MKPAQCRMRFTNFPHGLEFPPTSSQFSAILSLREGGRVNSQGNSAREADILRIAAPRGRGISNLLFPNLPNTQK